MNTVPSFYCKLWWIALHFASVQITKSAPAGLVASDMGLPVGKGLGTNAAASTSPHPTQQERFFEEWFWRWFTTPMTTHLFTAAPNCFAAVAVL
ncbi:MAG: hypothetical protein V4772_18490 [Pseudomonadota bacterium]